MKVRERERERERLIIVKNLFTLIEALKLFFFFGFREKRTDRWLIVAGKMVRRVSENPEEIGRDKLTFPRNRAYRGRSRGRTHGKLVRAAIQSLPFLLPPRQSGFETRATVPCVQLASLFLYIYIYTFSIPLYPTHSTARLTSTLIIPLPRKTRVKRRI